MNIEESLEKFIKRADRIDINMRSSAHIVSVGDNSISIILTGSKVEGPNHQTDSRGVTTIGNASEFIDEGGVYIEFKDVEIFESQNTNVVNNIANLIKDRYDEIKLEYTEKFVSFVDRLDSPYDLELELEKNDRNNRLQISDQLSEL